MRILAVVISGAIVARMLGARRGREYFIRRIPGIDAIEESVGRATETGKPVLFVPGWETLQNMQTLAGLGVLSWVARRCVQMMVRVIVPVSEPLVVSAAGDILREAYRQEGAEDRFSSQDVIFLGKDESAFAAGVIGIMNRENVAAGFYFGGFGYESLLIAESGNRAGLVQVAATADFFQIPFFLCACDYTLIGEELFAASAYLSRDPVQIGALSGQDFGKALLLFIIAAGILFALYFTLAGVPEHVMNPVQGVMNR